MRKKRICVFCGSATGKFDHFKATAERVGELCASLDIELVYGGGRLGLMGAMADAALSAGGTVIGVMPQGLVDREVAHVGLTELIIVQSMHDRKARMEALSDGFLAMPGGFGTLDEFFEILTWSQIGIHQKPCSLLNVGGYFDDVIAFMDGAVHAGFVIEQHRDMVLVADDPETLLLRLLAYKHEAPTKWTVTVNS